MGMAAAEWRLDFAGGERFLSGTGPKASSTCGTSGRMHGGCQGRDWRSNEEATIKTTSPAGLEQEMLWRP